MAKVVLSIGTISPKNQRPQEVLHLVNARGHLIYRSDSNSDQPATLENQSMVGYTLSWHCFWMGTLLLFLKLIPFGTAFSNAQICPPHCTAFHDPLEAPPEITDDDVTSWWYEARHGATNNSKRLHHWTCCQAAGVLWTPSQISPLVSIPLFKKHWIRINTMFQSSFKAS